MANVLLTYDISSKHTEVKEAMKAKSYLDYWTNGNKRYQLPNTTLWTLKANVSPSVVIQDLTAVVAELNRTANPKIVLERAVAVEFTTWDGIQGLSPATR